MLEGWIKEVKEEADPDNLGMMLMHNGVVRGTSKDGRFVKKMRLSYDKEALQSLIDELKQRGGIIEIKAWINSGKLNIGDDIMYLLVAGRFRTDIMPVFQELLSRIKNDIVREVEVE